MLRVSAAKAAIVGIKLGKDLSGVTMSCHSGRPEDQDVGYMGGLGTYLSGTGDLWQYLLLLGHLQPLQPYHMSPQIIGSLGLRRAASTCSASRHNQYLPHLWQ